MSRGNLKIVVEHCLGHFKRSHMFVQKLAVCVPGIFTAPTDGRYLVTALLAAQTGEKLEVVLSVSNHSVQKLGSAGFLSETEPRQRCGCSASTSLSLVVQMKRGAQAGLVLTAGKLAVSDSAQVLSSFSVVLLYANPVTR